MLPELRFPAPLEKGRIGRGWLVGGTIVCGCGSRLEPPLVASQRVTLGFWASRGTLNASPFSHSTWYSPVPVIPVSSRWDPVAGSPARGYLAGEHSGVGGVDSVGLWAPV